MPDIRFVQSGTFPTVTAVSVDWLLLGDGSLDETEALATAVIVALGTDRLAEPGERLPDPDSVDRRGWWGDLDAEQIWDGWPIGSRLWLLMREKITGAEAYQGATITRVEHYIREALQPFIDRRVASQLEVRVTRVNQERIDALIRMYRGPDIEIELRYQILWEDIME
jgi:phage gp46-like protein